jgi:cytochrome-b5 reductase
MTRHVIYISIYIGPKGNLEYLGEGKITINMKSRKMNKYKVKKIGMIAGGTGITPMLQVIRAALKDPFDDTEMWLLFANQTEEDILLRKELEAIPKNRLHVWYTLDRPPAIDWGYSTGFINKDMCAEHLPPKVEGATDTIILMCGPPPMIKFACEPALKELGFDENDYYSF